MSIELPTFTELSVLIISDVVATSVFFRVSSLAITAFNGPVLGSVYSETSVKRSKSSDM